MVQFCTSYIICFINLSLRIMKLQNFEFLFISLHSGWSGWTAINGPTSSRFFRVLQGSKITCIPNFSQIRQFLQKLSIFIGFRLARGFTSLLTDATVFLMPFVPPLSQISHSLSLSLSIYLSLSPFHCHSLSLSLPPSPLYQTRATLVAT